MRVAPRGDVVGNLAAALGAVTPPAGPQDRWSEERLPDLLDRWYQEVAAGS
jgi:hypothetical protein